MRRPPEPSVTWPVSERDILLTQNDRLRHAAAEADADAVRSKKSERLPEERSCNLGWKLSSRRSPRARRRKPRSAIAKSCARTMRPSGGRAAAPCRPSCRGSEVTLVPDDTACPCCRAAMTVIGEDKSERLDVIPVQYPGDRDPATEVRLSNLCPVLRRGAGARAGAALIEGGLPTEALVAQVA